MGFRKENGMNSNRKGKVFERWVAAYLREHGHADARRGQQYKGGADSPDVVGLDGFHVECKNTQKWDAYGFMEQSVRDAGEGEKPIVIAKKNFKEPLVLMRLDDFMEVIKSGNK
jgi:Holliday junction resolvase